MKNALLPFVLLALSLPAAAAPVAVPETGLLARGFAAVGPEIMARTGSPSLGALAALDLGQAENLSKLNVMAKALPATDREELERLLAAEPIGRDEVVALLLRTAQGAERYANRTEQRLEALAAEPMSEEAAARYRDEAEELLGNPFMSAPAAERLAAAHAALREKAGTAVAPKAERAVSRFAGEAIRLMAEHGRDLSPSIDRLERVDNEHQLEAIRVLLEGNASDGDTYQIANKMDAILAFNNARQVEALRALVDAGRLVSPSIGSIAAFDNAHQPAAVRLLLEHDRQVAPSIEAIEGFRNEHAVNALRTLLEAPGQAYQASDKMSAFSRFDSEHAVTALRSLVSRDLPVRPLLSTLVSISTAEQAEAAERFAQNARQPSSRPRRLVLAGWLLALLAATQAASSPGFAVIAVLALAGATAAVLYSARAARLKARAANRAWLDADPDVEAKLGPVPDLY